MSRDNLKIGFRVHTVWRVDGDQVPLFMERYSTTVDRESIHRDPDAVVKVAYANFVKEPLRTFSLDEVQRRNGLEVKDALIAIGEAVLARIRTYAAGSPFLIDSVVVGNVQYPEEVANAVSRKLAATQELARKDTEIEIERKERTKREVQAQGIANAMQIIRGQLSAMYIQHEAIEAQKAMVGSPNHTVVYIPVGPMGVPITATMDATATPAVKPSWTTVANDDLPETSDQPGTLDQPSAPPAEIVDRLLERHPGADARRARREHRGRTQERRAGRDRARSRRRCCS